MLLKLKVYKGKEVEKEYTTDTYDLMFGTLEDFINVIDLDKLSDGNDADFVKAIGKVVVGGMDQLKPLLLDVFEGLTEEELRRTKVKELTVVVLDILKYSIAEIKGASKRKNA